MKCEIARVRIQLCLLTVVLLISTLGQITKTAEIKRTALM